MNIPRPKLVLRVFNLLFTVVISGLICDDHNFDSPHPQLT